MVEDRIVIFLVKDEEVMCKKRKQGSSYKSENYSIKIS